MRIINNKLKISITSDDGLFLKKIINQINKEDFLIIDKCLMNKYLFMKKIHKKYKDRILIVEGSEKIKTIKEYSKLIEKIINIGINRNSKLYSFGGGTVGDLSGFVASTVLRGVEHIMIPTTLLAMVDSSIGGKTGVNSQYGKNLIGTFYLPKSVMINTNFLKKLPLRELSCGFAEIIKYSFIEDKKLKKILINNSINQGLKEINIKAIIERSINTKLKFIKDFREIKFDRYSRAILNFGHTFAHAVENLNLYKNNIKHGEAVALGMIIEIKISQLLGFEPNSEETLIKILNNFNLSIDYKKFISKRNINLIFEKIYRDKKSFDKKIKLILIKKDRGIVNEIQIDKLKKLTLRLI